MHWSSAVAQAGGWAERSQNLRGFQFVQFAEEFPIERNDHDFVDEVSFAQQFGKRGCVARFALDKRHAAAPANKIQGFAQQRSRGSGKFCIEPAPGIEHLNFRRRLL